MQLTPTVAAFLGRCREALGIELRPGRHAATVLAKLGPIARMVGATLRNTANPTMLNAGYKVNVDPGRRQAQVDGRFLPGHEEEFFAEIDALLGPDVQREFVHHDIALETDFDGALVAAHDGRAAGRGPAAQAGAVLPVGRAPTRSRSAGWGSGASGSPRCGCRPTWTSPGCSMASTSGFRSTRCSSARACSTGSSTCAEAADATAFLQLTKQNG